MQSKTKKNPIAAAGGRALVKKRGRDWMSKIGKRGRRKQLKDD